MEICPDEKSLRHFMVNALKISEREGAPVLIDHFLDAATEVDVDVVADFEPSSPPSSLRRSVAPSLSHRAVVCGVMEHIEQAGIHSGDSACSVPPWSLRGPIVERIKDICRRLAEELRVCGLMNVQLAIKDDKIYMLEVNPRASRTAPFVGKARHTAWPMIAAKVAMGKTLDELGIREQPDTIGPGSPIAFKEPVFPFGKFPGVDVVLGPEMRSTGEVMGIDASMPLAYAKAKMAAGVDLPTSGGVFISVREADRPLMVDVARSLLAMGFKVYCTQGTGEYLNQYSLRTWILQKIAAGARPNVIDLMSNKEIGLIINTPTRTGWQTDEGKIRASAVRLGVPMITTATAATVAVRAIEALRAGDWGVAALQDYARARPEVVIPRGARSAAPASS
jgi:carbamoyl-phosphate synthase large subunit